jgi:hypothetical protein
MSPRAAAVAKDDGRAGRSTPGRAAERTGGGRRRRPEKDAPSAARGGQRPPSRRPRVALVTTENRTPPAPPAEVSATAVGFPITRAEEGLDPETRAFYRRAMRLLRDAGVEFLVGGAYAFERYTGIGRHTKDFDVFIRERDLATALAAFERDGCRTEVPFPHWLGKAYCGDHFVDVIFSSGNGVAPVDDEWFALAPDDKVLGIPVKLMPAEEMIWQKALIMERERFDGADVAHLLRARGPDLDWPRLLRRFDRHWRVLLAHLTLFGFIYPDERGKIPAWVMGKLLGRLTTELGEEPPDEGVCNGTVLSRTQYVVDLERWGYKDARVEPLGQMTAEEAAAWTEAGRATP